MTEEEARRIKFATGFLGTGVVSILCAGYMVLGVTPHYTRLEAACSAVVTYPFVMAYYTLTNYLSYRILSHPDRAALAFGFTLISLLPSLLLLAAVYACLTGLLRGRFGRVKLAMFLLAAGMLVSALTTREVAGGAYY